MNDSEKDEKKPDAPKKPEEEQEERARQVGTEPRKPILPDISRRAIPW